MPKLSRQIKMLQTNTKTNNRNHKQHSLITEKTKETSKYKNMFQKIQHSKNTIRHSQNLPSHKRITNNRHTTHITHTNTTKTNIQSKNTKPHNQKYIHQNIQHKPIPRKNWYNAQPKMQNHRKIKKVI